MAGLLQYYYFPTDFFYPKPKQLSDTINNNNNCNRHPQRQHLNSEGSSQVEFDSDHDSDKKIMNRSVSGRDLRMPAKAVKASISLQKSSIRPGGEQERVRNNLRKQGEIKRGMRILDTISKWIDSLTHRAVAEGIPIPQYYVPCVEPDMVQELEKDAMEEVRNLGVDRQAYSMQDYDRELVAIRTAAGSRQQNENVRLWLWSLVHSKSVEHVKQGMLIIRRIHTMETVRWVTIGTYILHCPLKMEEEHYLSAVGYYKLGHYIASLGMLEESLEISPYWEPALSLQELIDYEMSKASNNVILASASIAGAIVGAYYGTVHPESFLN